MNMTTCWIALDDTHADTGTIYYARGSNHWPRQQPGGQFHAPDDWTGYLRERGAGRDCGAVEWVPIEVPAGGCAFHDGWCWHGSRRTSGWIASGARSSPTWSPPTRAGTRPTATRSTAATCGPASSRWTRRSIRSCARDDGYRTPYIDRDYAPLAGAA